MGGFDDILKSLPFLTSHDCWEITGEMRMSYKVVGQPAKLLAAMGRYRGTIVSVLWKSLFILKYILFFREVLMHRNMEQKVERFPICLLPPRIHNLSHYHHSPHAPQSGTFVMTEELH